MRQDVALSVEARMVTDEVVARDSNVRHPASKGGGCRLQVNRCAYRETETARTGRSVPSSAVSRQDWLDSRREALHARMRERRERDLARHGDGFDLITRF